MILNDKSDNNNSNNLPKKLNCNKSDVVYVFGNLEILWQYFYVVVSKSAPLFELSVLR